MCGISFPTGWCDNRRALIVLFLKLDRTSSPLTSMGMATQVKHTERLLMSPPYLVSFVFAGISQERTSY